MFEWAELAILDDLTVRLVATPSGLSAVHFRPFDNAECRANDRNEFIVEAGRQLRAYFGGELREFRVPLDLIGTPFQLRVWRCVETIPFGETRGYSQVAAAIGSPKAVRAVGAANGANPVPIIVPCHRAIGSNGKLVGYGGGLPLKRKLLDLERGPALFR